MKKRYPFVLSVLFLLTSCKGPVTGMEPERPDGDGGVTTGLSYPIVGTNQQNCYSDVAQVGPLLPGDRFYGQDANNDLRAASYRDNGDGTVTDEVTGLMWQQDMGEKMSFAEAQEAARTMRLGGYSDWRVPTIKELYSLIQFSGQVKGEVAVKLFIDTDYFNQPLGDVASGEREIDAQTWSATKYVGRAINGEEVAFGVNFIDGRIKGYPIIKKSAQTVNRMYFRMVRGNSAYGQNAFVDNGDGTITDVATGLMWQKRDDGQSRDWEQALAYAENLELAGYSDWRLPSAKELQSLVDYSRSPQTTQSAAIDGLFETTEIVDPEGNGGQYPYFWTGTTHLDGVNPYTSAVYVAFGEAQGEINGVLMDVHGAGAQRSDPKSGNREDYPQYLGPQGDVRYVYNYVRAVRVVTPRSVPDDVPTAAWKFAVLGDTHVPASDVLGQLVPRLIDDGVQLVIFPGDLIQGGKGQNAKGMREELAAWVEMTEPLRNAGIEILAVRGNHEADVKNNSITPWQTVFGPELNVVKRWNGVLFVGLDNYVNGEQTVDVDWLREALQNSEDEAVVVFGHEPAFTSYTFHSECLDVNRTMRDAFWHELEAASVPYYFCGHAHQYNVTRITSATGSVVQVVSGGGGGTLQPKRRVGEEPDYVMEPLAFVSEHGYTLVTVADGVLTQQWQGVTVSGDQDEQPVQREGQQGAGRMQRGS